MKVTIELDVNASQLADIVKVLEGTEHRQLTIPGQHSSPSSPNYESGNHVHTIKGVPVQVPDMAQAEVIVTPEVQPATNAAVPAPDMTAPVPPSPVGDKDIEDIRALLLQLNADQRVAMAKKLCAKYNVPRLSNLPAEEMTPVYAEIQDWFKNPNKVEI